MLFSIFLVPIRSVASPYTPASFQFLEDKWQKAFSKDGISVFSQKIPDSAVLAFKATGILKAPIEQIMEVLRRVEITKDWMPDTDIKETVKDISDYEAITFSVNDLPWPFADRELLMNNRLRLDREEKFLVVDLFSVELAGHPITKNNVRAFLHMGKTLMRPVGESRTEIEFILLLDPRGHIPTWWVNIFQKSMPFEFLKALERKAGETEYYLRQSFRKILNELIALLQT